MKKSLRDLHHVLPSIGELAIRAETVHRPQAHDPCNAHPGGSNGDPSPSRILLETGSVARGGGNVTHPSLYQAGLFV